MKSCLYFTAIILAFALLQIEPSRGAGESETKVEVESSSGDTAITNELDANILMRKVQIAQTPEGQLQPWRLLRSIQRAQDDIVSGKKDAIKAYRILLLQSANWMKSLDISTWQYQKNLDAVAVYLLIGGDVELGYKALRHSKLEKPYKLLLEAAIAYAEQDVRTANTLFQGVDHKLLPPSMSGQVALAKSMMMSSSDLAEALHYLDEARKLAPGTLVEEAAIRRSIRIVAEEKNLTRLKGLMRTYMFRFPGSYYFNDFLRNVSYALVNVLEHSSESIISEFQFLLERVGPSQRVAIAEYAMRRAVIGGDHEFVEWLAKHTLPEVDKNSKAHTRLKLYHLASKVRNKNEISELVMELETLPIGRLSEKDLKIYEAVSATGYSILYDEEFPVLQSAEEFEKMNMSGQENPDTGSTEDPLAMQERRLAAQVSELEKLSRRIVE